MEGLSVDKDLSNGGALHVVILKLFRGDVLSLGELEDVLRSVNDLDGSVGQDLHNVSRVDPAVIVKGFLSLLGVLEVATEHIGAEELEFSSRGIVVGEVAQFGAVSESHFHSGAETADMASSGVLGHSACDGAG